MKGFLKFLFILVFLNLFFISVSLMGAFKGETKAYLEVMLSTLYDNPFLGLLIGILATSIMQSSSATTSVVVSFVALGFFGADPEHALYSSIPIIMGANIGTSITSVIVSLGHIGDSQEFKRAFSAALVHDIFNLMTVAILFPIQIFTNFLGKMAIWMTSVFSSVGGMKFAGPLEILVKPQAKFIMKMFESHDFLSKVVLILISAFVLVVLLNFMIKESLTMNKRTKYFILLNSAYLGLVVFFFSEYPEKIFTNNVSVFALALTILFVSLNGFVSTMKSVTSSKMEVIFSKYIFKNPASALLMGIIFTVIVQSSSVSISVMIPLVGAGILNICQIFPYTIGANIGTTITAILAALSLGDFTGIAIAFAHMSFNIVGASIIFPLRFIPIKMAEGLAGLSIKNKLIPFLFILLVYLLIPFVGIMIFK